MARSDHRLPTDQRLSLWLANFILVVCPLDNFSIQKPFLVAYLSTTPKKETGSDVVIAVIFLDIW